MAGGVSIQVEGLDRLIKKLGAIPENVKAEIDASLSAAAKGFEDRAVGDAPTHVGFLKNQITTKRIAEMDYEVVAGSEYAAYVEFGTRLRVHVPPGLEAYAAQFMGKTGRSAEEAKKAIYEWCRLNGIEPKKWWGIFMKIMTVGINPHPFFFRQMPQAQTEVHNDLKVIVKEALK